jgi:hypothetical protein
MFDHIRADPHNRGVMVDNRPGLLKQAASVRRPEFNAGGFEYLNRRVVDLVDLLGAKNVKGAVGILDLSPRQLWDS